MSAALVRCAWCGKPRRTFSDYEQQVLVGPHDKGKWKRLCTRCANRRLDNPWGGLLPMRPIGSGEDGGES